MPRRHQEPDGRELTELSVASCRLPLGILWRRRRAARAGAERRRPGRRLSARRNCQREGRLCYETRLLDFDEGMLLLHDKLLDHERLVKRLDAPRLPPEECGARRRSSHTTRPSPLTPMTTTTTTRSI